MTGFPCHHCGRVNDQASNPFRPEDSVAEAGDWSLCIDCGYWGVFTGVGVETRPPTVSELLEIASTPTCRAAMRAWRMTKARMN